MADLDTDWHDRFLDRLREGWSITYAAQAAGVTRQTVFRHRRDLPEFDQAVRDANEAGLDAAEDAIRKWWRRDWRSAEAMLKAKRRDVYGTSRVELTGKDGNAVELVQLTETERAARAAALLAAAEARKKAADELLG